MEMNATGIIAVPAIVNEINTTLFGNFTFLCMQQ